MTDEVLMLAVRGGDVAKLGLLFERYHVALFDYLNRMTGSRAVAEDLVQEVFVRVLKYRATFRDEGAFDTWVFRIARNARTDYFKKHRAEQSVPDEQLERAMPPVQPARDLERGRDLARLRRALMALREDKRELIVLARYREMKYEQIAEILGVDIGTVKVRMHRALKELREVFMRLSDGQQSCDVKTSTRSLRII